MEISSVFKSRVSDIERSVNSKCSLLQFFHRVFRKNNIEIRIIVNKRRILLLKSFDCITPVMLKKGRKMEKIVAGESLIFILEVRG